jgi:hypothetical protein
VSEAECKHPQTAIYATPTRYEEEGVVILTIRVKCEACGTHFQFRGLSEDPSPHSPWVSCDGFTAALPMTEKPRVVS